MDDADPIYLVLALGAFGLIMALLDLMRGPP
jgi:nitrate reductase NapE component